MLAGSGHFPALPLQRSKTQAPPNSHRKLLYNSLHLLVNNGS